MVFLGKLHGAAVLGVALASLPVLSMAHDETLHNESIIDSFLALVMTFLPLLALAGVGAAGLIAWHAVPDKRRVVAPATGVLVVLIAVAGLWGSVLMPAGHAMALSGAAATVYKSPTCGCCGGYIAALRREGAEVEVIETDDLTSIKEAHGIPPELGSCHTALMDGYTIEGHVPIEALEKLRNDRPEISGIALPGMPSGTPGMPGLKTGPYRIQSLDGAPYLTI